MNMKYYPYISPDMLAKIIYNLMKARCAHGFSDSKNRVVGSNGNSSFKNFFWILLARINIGKNFSSSLLAHLTASAFSLQIHLPGQSTVLTFGGHYQINSHGMYAMFPKIKSWISYNLCRLVSLRVLIRGGEGIFFSVSSKDKRNTSNW